MLLSIVIPHKGDLAPLTETLQQIFTHEGKEFEVIIVEKDKANVTYIENNYPKNKCKIFRREGHIYDAMNIGIKKARGNYLWFLGAGDLPYNDQTISDLIVQIQIELKRKIPRSLVAPVLCFSSTFSYMKKYSGNFAQKDFLLTMPIVHQGIVYPRSEFKSEYYDSSYRIVADYDFTIKKIIANKDRGFRKIDFPIARFPLTGVSSTQYFTLYKELLQSGLSNFSPKWHLVICFKYIMRLLMGSGVMAIKHLRIYTMIKKIQLKVMKKSLGE